MKLTIEVGQGHKSKTMDHEADFVAVRTVGIYDIGWATVETEGASFRFPAIVSLSLGRVATVSDWQAPYYATLDLSKPEDVASLEATGSGSFVWSRTGSPASVSSYFSKMHKPLEPRKEFT